MSGNTAYYEGGGIYNAGALTVSNSVFSSNNPDAIYNVGSSIKPAQPRCCPKCGSTRLIYRELPTPTEVMPTTAGHGSS